MYKCFFSVNVFRRFHYDNQTVSREFPLEYRHIKNLPESSRAHTDRTNFQLYLLMLNRIVLRNRRSTDLHKYLFQQMLPGDGASTFKPVAPGMKSTLAKYAHKSMISLLSTSLVNIYDKDEVPRRADYNFSSYHCSLFWSTALFTGGKISSNVREESQSWRSPWKGSARYLDLDYLPLRRCWEQNIEIMIPQQCITTNSIHLIMTSTKPQSFPLYRCHCCFLLWFNRLW